MVKIPGKKEAKGITLIALIITIIVLLILAGITINSLTGSDSAPAKANEAAQKNDIGTAKDEISLLAVNAKTEGYETAYVGNGVSAGDASKTVGQAVIDAVKAKNGTNVGKASISVEQTMKNEKPDDATITITTRDFEVEGTITIQDGILTWGEIEELTPGLTLRTTSLNLAPGEEGTINYKVRGISGNVTWTSNNPKVTVANGIVTVANDAEEGTATVTATIGEYTKTCSVTIEIKTGIILSTNSLPLELGGDDTITATLKGITTTEDVTWNVPSTNIFTTTITGNSIKITADDENAGTANITASITVNGTTYTSKVCTITVSAGKSAQVNSIIGQIVAYPKASDTVAGYTANYTGTWRVFYADSKQMFIIPTGIAENNVSLSLGSYSDSNDVFAERTTGVVGNKTVTYGLTYNSRWKEKLGTGKDSQNRSKATAYMCDPANWTRYVASNAPDGTYAVGGPTKELLAAAWEATGRSAEWADRTTTTDVSEAGYAYIKPSGLRDQDPIQRTILPTTTNGQDGLFNNGTSYWLASPSSRVNSGVCRVDRNGYVNDDTYDGRYGLRPLVSIPLSHVNITGTEGNYSVSLDFVGN